MLSSPAAERGDLKIKRIVILRNEGSVIEYARSRIDASLRSA